MVGTLIAFLLQQTFVNGNWPMYGATLENTHFQAMKGDMSTEPVVKWSYVTRHWVENYGSSVDDVNGDAKMEVVFGSSDSNVYCLDGATGGLNWSYSTGDQILSAPSLIDINGDGTMEVIIGSWDSKVYCLNGITGGLNWSYSTGGGVLISSPAVRDINGDGTKEVIIGGGNSTKRIFCLNGVTGVINWSYTVGLLVESSPAVADVNGDGTIEVVFGSDDSKVYCLNGVTGGLDWSYTTGNCVTTAPAVADLNGNGTMEVVFGSGDNKIYCLDGVNGVVNWSYATGGQIWASPALANMDADGNVEVIIGSNDRKVYCLDGATGGVDWSYGVPAFPHRGISTADVEGDNQFEVIVPNMGTGSGIDTITCINNDGTVLWKKDIVQDIHDITIADVDNDSCIELVCGTYIPGKLFVLDDVGNASNCGNMGGVEEGTKKQDARCKIEFKTIGDKIYLYTPRVIEANIKIYDLCGREKCIIYSGILSEGNYTFSPNITGKGVYFIVLRAGNISKSEKLIKL